MTTQQARTSKVSKVKCILLKILASIYLLESIDHTNPLSSRRFWGLLNIRLHRVLIKKNSPSELGPPVVWAFFLWLKMYLLSKYIKAGSIFLALQSETKVLRSLRTVMPIFVSNIYLKFLSALKTVLPLGKYLAVLSLPNLQKLKFGKNSGNRRLMLFLGRGKNRSSWARVIIVNLFLAWVSGVSGKRGKDGSEKGRELKERNACHRCFSTGAFHPHTAWFDTIQSKSLPVIGFSATRFKKLT